MQTFDLINHPLSGTTLIEANAGTGKTYTITGLFLRLILERNLAVDQILVVTFTEAATAELKDRIRQKLHDALERLAEKTPPDPDADLFLKEYVPKIPQPEQAQSRLREALNDFDRAAIFTIHGFCRRILHEQAFESGELFDTELITDQEDLKREILADFWRRNFYRASPLFVHYALQNKVHPDTLAGLCIDRFIQADLKIIPAGEPVDTAAQEAAFALALEQVRKSWTESRTEIENLLLNNESLNKTQYKPANIPLWIQNQDLFLKRYRQDPFLFKEFTKFTSSSLIHAVKKNSVAPAHPFFDFCEILARNQEELLEAFAKRLLGLKLQLLRDLKNELGERKRQKNLQSFDDLLHKVRKVLRGKNSGTLTRVLQSSFKAALIDEFQDTDLVQYEIFRHIFSGPQQVLFLIGDPKQAIYGFRGADLFTYLAAAEQIPERYTLLENWRSQPGLIRAVNTLFSSREHPFVYEQIGFAPSLPARSKRSRPKALGTDRQAALRIWFMASEHFSENQKPILKGRARKAITRATAAEISRLLQPVRELDPGNGPGPWSAEEIAVLVRRNSEARRMQEALNDMGIPSVLYSSGNLFESREAREMERVLKAIAKPHDNRLLKAALASDLLGMSGEEIERADLDENRREGRVLQFRSYHDSWLSQGFMRMFYAMVSENQVLERLIAYTDGERRVTNLLHLAEILQQTQVARKWNQSGLVKWLAEKIAAGAGGSEEQPLRLEKDDRSVKLVTIHKSKGLEYRVVFCPFLWDGSRSRHQADPLIFHDPVGKQMVLDLGSAELEEHRAMAEIEALAENMRLLYVALTRARERCHLVWGRFKEAESSAPAYLLHGPRGTDPRDLLDVLAENFRKLDDADLFGRVRQVAGASFGDMSVISLPDLQGHEYQPTRPEPVQLDCRSFRGLVEQQWRITSFSGLSAEHTEAIENPDHDTWSADTADEALEIPEIESRKPVLDIFAFPKGTRAGECIHKIFENLDFTNPDAEANRMLIHATLKGFGFAEQWEPAIRSMTRKVMLAPLSGPDPGLTLDRIRKQNRIHELEFYFPLQFLKPENLADIFRTHQENRVQPDFTEQMGRLNFAPVKGFIKGFMDLVFEYQGRYYLADWKSNHLGDRAEDYDPVTIFKAMNAHFYFLQYHLYTVALHQYLKWRLPQYDYEKHFGGVYYLFVRGMDPDKGNEYGVFYDRPKQELIEELCGRLIERN